MAREALPNAVIDSPGDGIGAAWGDFYTKTLRNRPRMNENDRFQRLLSL
jgi:hypothetical protein